MADELVYVHCYGEQEPDFTVSHRIIKRTKTRIYVDREIHDDISRRYWEEHPERRQCFTLDRQAFERDGYAEGRRLGSLDTYYVTEALALNRS